MSASVQAPDAVNRVVETQTQLRGVLRRRGEDYLLEEHPLPPPAPWPTGKIWRVDMAEGSATDLDKALDREVVVSAAPCFVPSRRHVVMRITSVRPV